MGRTACQFHLFHVTDIGPLDPVLAQSFITFSLDDCRAAPASNLASPPPRAAFIEVSRELSVYSRAFGFGARDGLVQTTLCCLELFGAL